MLTQKRGISKWFWILLIMILIIIALTAYLFLFSDFFNNLPNNLPDIPFQIPGSDSVPQPPALPS